MSSRRSPSALLVIFGNQLFAPRHLPSPTEVSVFLAEDYGICTSVCHHQQKIVLFLAAMRSYADELRAAGFEVHYLTLDAKQRHQYEDRLKKQTRALDIDEIRHFEVEDKAIEKRLADFTVANGLQRTELPTPMFVCSRSDFSAFVSEQPRLLMGDFYKYQRRQMNILVDSQGRPQGGRWTFDEENRKKLPRKQTPPDVNWPEPTEHVKEVIEIVRSKFSDHAGKAEEFRWPTTREQAEVWLNEFVETRLENFGPFEDAITQRSVTVFHSVLSPILNLGLLTPDEVIDRRSGWFGCSDRCGPSQC